MHKAIKYITLSVTFAVAALSAGAKVTPGIPPVYHPAGDAESSAAWTSLAPGTALSELENRAPENALRSLVQSDGIINFRPVSLTGLSAQTGSIAPINALAPNRIPGGSNLCGFIAYNESDLDLGIYRLPVATGQSITPLRLTPSMLSSFRGGASSDRFYVMSYYGLTIQNGLQQCLTAIFDKNDWSLIAETGDYGHFERVCSDMTYDPVTDRFYGCFLDRKQSRWLLGYMQVNESSPASTISAVTPLSTLEVSLNGIAADANGVIWGIRNDNGELVTIDKKTGAMTTKASTGFVPGYNGSLTWDNANGILYWSVTYDDSSSPVGMSSAILSVDPQTGSLSQVYKFPAPTQICGLYTEYTAAALSPGQFTDFKVNFEGESLSGTVSFNAPATLTDGSSASGSFDYIFSVVKENGFVACNKTLSASYGEKNISLPVTLNTPGNYTFSVQALNDAGRGYPSSETRYVGPDLPQSAANIVVAYDAGKVTLTWDKVDKTVNGGYFDPEKVRYIATMSVVDADGNVTNLASRSVVTTSAEWDVETTDALRGFQASVTPVFDQNEGETAETAWKWYGYIKPPFNQTMKAHVDGWKAVNAGTGSMWKKEFSGNGSGWAIEYIWGSTNNSWLFSPDIMLEKGRYYTLSLRSWSPIVTNTVHVWIGRDATVDAMDTKLLDLTVNGKTTEAKAPVSTFGFLCPETGIYHLGIHNDTKSDTYTNVPHMWINDVTCDVAPDDAPDAPALDVAYDRTGEVKAQIKITAPATTYAGASVEKFDVLTLEVNGVEVARWTDVESGTELEYEYTDTKSGTYTVIAKASLNDVWGVPAISNVFIGMSVPVDPEWVNVAEHPDCPGTIDVTWAPVSTATNGQEIDNSVISYNVMNILSNSYIERDVTEQPFVYKACDADRQTALLIAVNAQTSAGVSSTYGKYSNQSIQHVGKPYELPIRENFEGGTVNYSWSVVNQHSGYDHCSVIPARGNIAAGVDANGDGYCMQAFVPYENSQASLYSGIIDVPADARNPVFGIALYREYYGEDKENNNTLVVGILGDKTQGALAPLVAGSQDYGWQYYYYDLSAFKGQKVNLLFTFQTRSYTSHYIDDIRFFDAPEKDLALTALAAPAAVLPEKNIQFVATVFNLGTLRTLKDEATVELRRADNNECVATAKLGSISPFTSVNVVLTDKLNHSFDPEVEYTATVVYDGDSDSGNNSVSTTLALRLPTMPAPTGLTGARDENGFADICWTAPDLSPVYPECEIGFETSVEPSSANLEGFKTIDADGNEVMEDIGLAGGVGFTTFYHPNLAHSGSWMLVSPANLDGKAKEDWLISPALSGKAQTVSFYARTNWNACETFTVLTSSTGDSKEDFTQTALEFTTSSNDWTRIEIEVPEGTRYFAIVAKADDTTDLVYLMLDDFSFEGSDLNDGLDVTGYFAYRDNVKVAKAIPEEAWKDSEGTPGAHFYRVTANYGPRGESAPSNEFFLFTRGSGLEDINAAPGKVYSLPGRIVIEGAEGADISVAAINGIIVGSIENASATESVEVIPGVYIVTIDNSSIKLTVK